MIECIKKIRGARSLLILGDFNYPIIHWNNGMVRTRSRAAESFSESVQQQYLCQYVTSPKRVPGDEPLILVLLFTTKKNMVQNLEIVSQLGESDHSGLLFDFIPSKD